MNPVRIAVLAAALVAAVAAFFLLRSMGGAPAAAPPPAAAPAVEMVAVLVAKKDLGVGERVGADALGWQDWPKASVNPAYVQQVASPRALEDYANAVVRLPLVTGEPVTSAKLVLPNGAGTLSALLTPGMRAVTITITPDTGVAGFVLPEDRVDVVVARNATRAEGGQAGDRVLANVILENVRVLAIDQAFSNKENLAAIPGGTATLEVPAANVELLEAADRLGDLSLSLRAYADRAGPPLARPGADVMDQRPPRVAQSAPPAPSVREDDAAPAAAPTMRVYLGGRSPGGGA